LFKVLADAGVATSPIAHNSSKFVVLIKTITTCSFVVNTAMLRNSIARPIDAVGGENEADGPASNGVHTHEMQSAADCSAADQCCVMCADYGIT
jgi:hypothetical protein